MVRERAILRGRARSPRSATSAAQPQPAGHQRQLPPPEPPPPRPGRARLQMRGLDPQHRGGPVGFQIHACRDGLALQERQDIVAVLALVRRGVDLQRMRAPNSRSVRSRRQIRLSNGDSSAARRRAAATSRRTPGRPACPSPPRALGSSSPASTSSASRACVAGTRHAEVVAKVAAVATPRARAAIDQQRPMGVGLGGRRRRQDGGGQHPFGEVVDPLEAAPGPGGDLAGPEQPFERLLAVGPVPPAGLARPVREIAAGQRARPLDLAPDGVDIARRVARRSGRARSRSRRPLRRAIRQRNSGCISTGMKRGLMAPVFEQAGPPAPGLLPPAAPRG